MDVSVIIPTYNRADLLERCLLSLLSCGIERLEVIVVDDGGKDDSEAVCSKYPGVTYRWQENAGPAAARNHGFGISRGRYVAFIDSDDEWINGGAGRLSEQLDANPDVGMVFADSSMGNDESGFVSFVATYGGDAFHALPHEARPGGVNVFERGPLFVQLSTRNVMFLGSMLFRRETFAALEGFDRDLCGAADWDVFMRSVVAVPVAFSEGPPTSRYYKHDAGMSTNNDHMDQDFIKALDAVRRRCELEPEERLHLNGRIRHHVFGFAYHAYERGDHEMLRARLSQARDLGTMGLRERAFYLASYFPPSLVAALRRAKHASGV